MSGTHLIDGGPYGPGEYREVVRDVALSDLRSQWVGMLVDSFEAGLIRTSADLARCCWPILHRLNGNDAAFGTGGTKSRRNSLEASRSLDIAGVERVMPTRRQPGKGKTPSPDEWLMRVRGLFEARPDDWMTSRDVVAALNAHAPGDTNIVGSTINNLFLRGVIERRRLTGEEQRTQRSVGRKPMYAHRLATEGRA